MKIIFRMVLSLTLFSIFTGISAAQTPTVTVVRDLSFGMVITNTTSTIAPSDFGAGEIRIDFPNYSGYVLISITFNLPTNLTSGANTLPITFGTTSAAWNTTNSLSGSTVFNPGSGYTRFFNSNAPLTMYFWLGGSISPGNTQAAGDYTGTITINASALTLWPNFANHQASQNLLASVRIIRGLSMMSSGSLDFGLIVAGTTPSTLDAKSGSAPLITAAGSGGRRITVAYTTTLSLYDSYGNTLTFSPSLYGSNIYSNQAGSTIVSSGSNVSLSGSGRTTGYYYFWLGGSLNPVPAGQPPGSYAGTFTITVNY